MDRLGLGYEAIREVNPEVVYASLSGFGAEGPYRDRSAYDTVIQAYAGLAANQADPADGVPVFLRQTAADKITALYAAQAITAALFARAMGKGGQHVELAMMDAVASFLWADSAGNEVLLESDHSQNSSFVAGFRPYAFHRRLGHRHPHVRRRTSPACAGPSTSRAGTIRGWRPSGSATRTATYTAALVDMCYARAANMTMAEATARFEAQRVPFSMILSPDELTRDPHAVAVGLFEERDHHVVGPHPLSRAIRPSSVAPRPTPQTPRLRWASTPTRSSPSSAWSIALPSCGPPAWWPEHPSGADAAPVAGVVQAPVIG